jgi:molybdate transport system regulatory protein
MKAAPALRIRVDLAPGCSVGPGKVSLLEAIEREGSLSVAAKSIGMSYRRAWDLLSDLNHSFEEPVVATAVGGTQGGGARVTKFGHALMKAFRAVERDALKAATTRLRRFAPDTKTKGGPVRRQRVSARIGGARTSR